jgi:hypothetical protein
MRVIKLNFMLHCQFKEPSKNFNFSLATVLLRRIPSLFLRDLRLQLGLIRSLIFFATLAFVVQCQYHLVKCLCTMAFQFISKDFILPYLIPLTYCLTGFTREFNQRALFDHLIYTFCLLLTNNAWSTRFTAAAGTRFFARPNLLVINYLTFFFQDSSLRMLLFRLYLYVV